MTPEAPEATEQPQTQNRWLLACCLVLLAALAPYIPSWNGALVWDDHYLVDGSAIGGGKYLYSCFTTPFLNHYFRPLVSVCFYFERHLWHNNATGYRVVSTLLHVATTAILLRVLRDAFSSKRVAVVGALIFAIQPVQVGAVAWIGGRTDALCEFWLLLFLSNLIRAAQTLSLRRGWCLAWAVIFYTLAIFTKEQVLALLPLVPLAFRCWQPREGTNLRHTELVFTLPFLAVSALFLYMGYHLGMPRPSLFPPTIGEYFTQAGQIMCYYAVMLCMPNPGAMHTLSLGAFDKAGILPVIAGYAVLILCVFLLLRWKKSDPVRAWFLALVVLSLLPVTGFVPLPFLLVAPYRAAVAGIGLAALAGRWLSGLTLHRETSRTRPLGAALTGVIAVWFGGLTVWGAIQWRDEINIFNHIIEADPNGIVTYYVRAFMVGDRGRYDLAASDLESALKNLFRSDAWKTQETAVKAVNSQPGVLQRTRQNQGSTDDPHIWLASVYSTLGSVYLKEGQNIAAMAAYKTAEAIYAKDADTQSGIGYCEGLFQNDAEGVRRMRLALSYNKEHALAHEWLARYYSRIGDWPSTVTEAQAWVKAAPQSTDAQEFLADANTQLSRRNNLQGNPFH